MRLEWRAPRRRIPISLTPLIDIVVIPHPMTIGRN
ncbi:hypothetical protein ThidrDRAFT_3106 [Thiorhodococcus drewsii AZ1]|uniref:Uncharacterized protein n=1 Tax=Thiorhodococcus drewsii AZ1 TaxID=765913 RepID=G2E493_9GAMM|nr:hypothetical protein ThidrDRAFT_3106 [Thiorhodococcus drewsii AZ1]